MKALLVGVAPEAATVVRRALGARGHEPIVANDGAAGLEVVLRESPALIVVQDPLADMTASDFCRQTRACSQGADAVILVITARDDELPAVLDAGATDLHTTALGPAALETRVLIVERLVSQHARLRDREPSVPTPLRVGRRRSDHLGLRRQLQGGQRRVPAVARLHARRNARRQAHLGGHLPAGPPGARHGGARPASIHRVPSPSRESVRAQGRATDRRARGLGRARRDGRVHHVCHRHLGPQGGGGQAAGVGGAVPRPLRALPDPQAPVRLRNAPLSRGERRRTPHLRVLAGRVPPDDRGGHPTA